MTAWSGKRAVLRAVTRQISASRIQNTWKSFLVERDARVEREEAILNQIINPLETKSENCSPEEPDPNRTSRQLLRWMRVEKKVVIGDLVSAKDHDDIIFAEPIEEFDGCEKSSANFTMIVATWLDHMGTNESFFGGAVKKWGDSPSSSNWSSYFTEILQLLKNGEVVILWGHTGGMKKLFPMNQGKITDLQNMWSLHLAEKKLARLILLQETADDPPPLARTLSDRSAWSRRTGHGQEEQKKDTFQFNPSATAFMPAPVSTHQIVRCSLGDEHDDLEERFMKLIQFCEYSQST
jgi:hypothetical protein